MNKIVVVIENDMSLSNAHYVNAFLESYEGDSIILTNFRNRSNEEIFGAVSKCTDIAVQTCFVNGSDDQLHSMVQLLSQIPHTINVYIAYIGISHQDELHQYLISVLKPKDILSISHHSIYAMSRDKYGEVSEREPHHLLDFSRITNKLKAELQSIQEYKNSACQRPTGRKIKVLGCTAQGTAFKNLPIGQVVDELECSRLVNPKSKHRGVWIWGNGEPITLVNDHGFTEYEIVSKMDVNEIFVEISKVVDTVIKLDKLKPLEQKGVLSIISNDETPMGKANLLCEMLNIEKRGNRQNIYKILQNNLLIVE